MMEEMCGRKMLGDNIHLVHIRMAGVGITVITIKEQKSDKMLAENSDGLINWWGALISDKSEEPWRDRLSMHQVLIVVSNRHLV